MRSRYVEVCIGIVLVVGILVVYGQVWHYGFINYDDPSYISENLWVQEGFTCESISRAFTATDASNWHPLTWVSHMADCRFFGLNPGAHHLTGLLFHILNALLVFIVFRLMTGAVWQSAFIAALFALHPLHVESVAWVAERKDVLSAFFWLLTMWGYLRYVRRPGVGSYLPVLLFFVMGLLSKPMVVTLPFVLLLMDWWPLGRFRWEDGFSQGVRLVWEKVPLFVLSAASSVVTFFVQQGAGAVSSLEKLPLSVRVANALVSYISYLGKIIWPHNLAIFYPHPGEIPFWQVAGAAVLLLLITVLVIRVIKRHPSLSVGWLWYVGTLVPVIGLVQVGGQSMADRYTYLPLIGVGIMVAWGVPAVMTGWRHRRAVLAVVSSSVLVVWMMVSWVQVGYWEDSVTLWRRSLAVAGGSGMAHNNLGTALEVQGNEEEAMAHFTEAVRIRPRFVQARMNLARLQVKEGRLEEALANYERALRLDPENSKAHHNLGAVLAHQGKTDGALHHVREAVRLDPGYLKARLTLGNLLLEQGHSAGAADQYREAVRIEPGNETAHFKLGFALMRQGEYEEAVERYSEAMRLNPAIASSCWYNIACVYALQGKTAESINALREAVRRGFDQWDYLRTDADLESIRSSAPFKELLEGRR